MVKITLVLSVPDSAVDDINKALMSEGLAPLAGLFRRGRVCGDDILNKYEATEIRLVVRERDS